MSKRPWEKYLNQALAVTRGVIPKGLEEELQKIIRESFQYGWNARGVVDAKLMAEAYGGPAGRAILRGEIPNLRRVK